MLFVGANNIVKNADIEAICNIFIDIVLYALVGFALAIIVMYYCKIIAGKGIRLLIESKAFDEESAKSLEELGITRNVKYHKSRLEKSAPQKYLCKCVDGEVKRYYIPKEKQDRAERTYSVNEKPLGMTIISVVITVIVALLIYFCSDVLVDKIKNLANDFVSSEIGGQVTDDGFFYDPNIYEDNESESGNESIEIEKENSNLEDSNE